MITTIRSFASKSSSLSCLEIHNCIWRQFSHKVFRNSIVQLAHKIIPSRINDLNVQKNAAPTLVRSFGNIRWTERELFALEITLHFFCATRYDVKRVFRPFLQESMNYQKMFGKCIKIVRAIDIIITVLETMGNDPSDDEVLYKSILLLAPSNSCCYSRRWPMSRMRR